MSQATTYRVINNAHTLPPAAQDELKLFVDYLKHKYKVPRRKIIALRGIWTDYEFGFDIEAEIRTLRRQAVQEMLNEWDGDEFVG